MLRWAVQTPVGQDLVTLKNGDQLHGQIKDVEHDILRFEAGSRHRVFEITWSDVVRFEAKATQSVELVGGDQYTGRVASSTDGRNTIVVMTAKGPVRFARSELECMADIGPGGLGNLRAGAELGFSLTRASGAKQLSIGGRPNYIGERWLASGLMNIVRNSQGGHHLQRLDSSGSS